MRAMILREPGPTGSALMCETVPDPVPGRREVVIQVAACGVCSHDIAVCTGILRAGIVLLSRGSDGMLRFNQNLARE